MSKYILNEKQIDDIKEFINSKNLTKVNIKAVSPKNFESKTYALKSIKNDVENSYYVYGCEGMRTLSYFKYDKKIYNIEIYLENLEDCNIEYEIKI